MRVCCLQMRSCRSVEDNLQTVQELVRAAASQGAEYVLTPEMTTLLERDKASLFSKILLQEDDPAVRRFADLACKAALYLHIGSMAFVQKPSANGAVRAVNRSLLFAPDGSLLTTYDKIHMFDVALDSGEQWRESGTYDAGSQAVTVSCGEMKAGLSICYDLRFPALYRALAQAGATMLTVPAAFTVPTGKAHWHALLRARAIENGAYVLAAAQGGLHEDGRSTYGHSLIIDPWGEIIAKKNDDTPGFIMADIRAEKAEAVRRQIPSLHHDRPFDLPDSI
jgi:predicted amidohydrolase